MQIKELNQQKENSLDSQTCWALLERVAESPQLKRSARLRELLLYVGRRSLQEGCERLSEQEIGVEVFGRRDTYDTSVDGIVRVNASELRKRIAAYFDSKGLHESLIMDIPRGSYIPVFRYRPIEQTSTAIASTSAPSESLPEAPPAFDRRLQVIVGLIILVLAACCVVLWAQNRAIRQLMYPWKYMPTVESLWSGFFDSNQDTDVIMEDSSFMLAQNLGGESFTFNDYISRAYIAKLQSKTLSPEMHDALNLISNKVLGRASDFRLVQHILALDPMGRKLHLYNAHEYMPSLVNKDNIIVLGNPTSNPWFLLFENRLNFVELPKWNDMSPVTNQVPAAGEQAIYMQTGSVGYCVVAYLPKLDGSGKVLLIEGTSSEATEAGGEFLLSEKQLSDFKKKLNADKLPYFELLLKTSQERSTPLSATVEAFRTYPGMR